MLIWFYISELALIREDREENLAMCKLLQDFDLKCQLYHKIAAIEIEKFEMIILESIQEKLFEQFVNEIEILNQGLEAQVQKIEQ